MDFEAQVEQELKGLNEDQRVAFAWRCAVRALPFLGSEGNFDFWKKKDIQKNLYYILYALDFASAYKASDFGAYGGAYYAAPTPSIYASAYAAPLPLTPPRPPSSPPRPLTPAE